MAGVYSGPQSGSARARREAHMNPLISTSAIIFHNSPQTCPEAIQHPRQALAQQAERGSTQHGRLAAADDSAGDELGIRETGTVYDGNDNDDDCDLPFIASWLSLPFVPRFRALVHVIAG
ncbi:uncharacterized protein PAC_19460 [Phialocephala subalpina]|uniref:Uncharacterized protein n=1 Tax=Phialocephala subalpina TaxID=576137 RepID=A0A1L7XX37_9HELO|nr:uncharacterized protein PAC_19460 [Phialocephala subalpina]